MSTLYNSIYHLQVYFSLPSVIYMHAGEQLERLLEITEVYITGGVLVVTTSRY